MICMKTVGLSKTFLVWIGLAFFAIVVAKTVLSYSHVQRLKIDFARKHAQTLNTFMEVHRNYYQQLYIDKIIPLHEETVIGLPAFSASPISEKFSQQNSLKIKVKTVSDNPRNPKNQADFSEMEAITSFRDHPAQKEYFYPADTLYQYATPLKIEPRCLRCHGEKEDAPLFIQQRYDHAYGYKLGELRGIISVQVPAKEIDHYFLAQFLVTLAYDVGTLSVVFGILYALMGYFRRLNLRLEDEIRKQTADLRHTNALFKSYKEAMDQSSIISKANVKGIITYINNNFARISGYTLDEAIGKTHNIVRHPDTPIDMFRKIWETITAQKVWKGVLANRSKEGETYWVDMAIIPILDEHKQTVEYIAVRHDVTELIHQREILASIAYTHPLSGLPNRVKLLEEIGKSSYRSVALFDLDKFSQINDVYGQNIGDKLLLKISIYLNRYCESKPAYYLYHLSGDEFAIVDASKETTHFLTDMLELSGMINQWHVLIDSYELLPKITVGISFESDQLLSTADMALKLAKKNKQNLFLYTSDLSLSTTYSENLRWIRVIENALTEDRFVVYYQKIIDNTSMNGEKYEALIRMIDPDGGIISPFYFLEISKHSKQYDAITRTVIKKTFKLFETMSGKCSINLTLEDILNLNLRTYLVEMLETHRIGDKLIFELVESEGIDNFDTVIDFIEMVKGYGCQIAIDDFGTGYSNFEYLMRLKADYIKIDGSIIKKLTTDSNAQAVVKAIVFFAQECGMKTIAEFVENEAIYTKVVEYGIDYSQGYYFSQPEPIEERSKMGI